MKYKECSNCDMKENCLAPECRVWQENNNYGIKDNETLEESIFSLEYELFYAHKGSWLEDAPDIYE